MHLFVYFKQKTAFEIRISDWSSDVCSSDLTGILLDHLGLDLEEFRVLDELDDLGALAAFDQHLHGAVGQAQQLQHRGNGADGVNRSEERRVRKECVSTCRSRGSANY